MKIIATTLVDEYRAPALAARFGIEIDEALELKQGNEVEVADALALDLINGGLATRIKDQSDDDLQH